MNQKEGLYSLLSRPGVYNSLQKVFRNQEIEELIVKDLTQCPGMKVLDIGCGPANLLRDPRLSQIEYYGIDPNPDYIRYAQKKYGKFGSFYLGYVTDELIASLPKIDVVILKGVIHHLSNSDVIRILKRLSLVSISSTRFITIDPCFIKDQRIIARILVGADRGNYVRHIDEYSMISNELFTSSQGTVIHGSWPSYDNFYQVSYGLRQAI